MYKKGRYFVGLFLLVRRNNTCRHGLHRITFIVKSKKKSGIYLLRIFGEIMGFKNCKS